jgi:hypothetical protein
MFRSAVPLLNIKDGVPPVARMAVRKARVKKTLEG